MDSVISSARFRVRPAAAWSPSASRARASSSSAVTIPTRRTPETEPSRTGESASPPELPGPVARRIHHRLHQPSATFIEDAYRRAVAATLGELSGEEPGA